MYDGIKTHRNSSAHYISVFLWRRLIFVIVVVLLDQFEYFKIQLFLLLQTFYLIYLGYSRPHSNNLFNWLDLFNEYFILCAGYYMMINTSFMPNLEVRYWFGWTAVYVFASLFVINLLVLLVSFVVEMKHRVRMNRLKNHFSVEYSRKELMESNFFKSGKDQGPTSIHSRLSKQIASKSERDISPRSKRDCLKRRRSLR